MEKRYASAGPNKQMYEMYNMSMRAGTANNYNNPVSNHAYIVENQSVQDGFNTYGGDSNTNYPVPTNEYQENQEEQTMSNGGAEMIANGSVDNKSQEESHHQDIENANRQANQMALT